MPFSGKTNERHVAPVTYRVSTQNFAYPIDDIAGFRFLTKSSEFIESFRLGVKQAIAQDRLFMRISVNFHREIALRRKSTPSCCLGVTFLRP